MGQADITWFVDKCSYSIRVQVWASSWTWRFMTFDRFQIPKSTCIQSDFPQKSTTYFRCSHSSKLDRYGSLHSSRCTNLAFPSRKPATETVRQKWAVTSWAPLVYIQRITFPIQVIIKGLCHKAMNLFMWSLEAAPMVEPVRSHGWSLWGSKTRSLKWTWELIEDKGVLCGTNTQRCHVFFCFVLLQKKSAGRWKTVKDLVLDPFLFVLRTKKIIWFFAIQQNMNISIVPNGFWPTAFFLELCFGHHEYI